MYRVTIYSSEHQPLFPGSEKKNTVQLVFYFQIGPGATEIKEDAGEGGQKRPLETSGAKNRAGVFFLKCAGQATKATVSSRGRCLFTSLRSNKYRCAERSRPQSVSSSGKQNVIFVKSWVCDSYLASRACGGGRPVVGDIALKT